MVKYVMALGTFDGVHLGHRALLERATALAGQLNIRAAAFTFAGHPRQGLTGRKVGLLCTRERRIDLLHEAGAELVAVEPFDEIRDLSGAEFVDLLVRKYGVAGLVCGEDYRFGKGGKSDSETLQSLCAARSLAFDRVAFVRDEKGEKISSDSIRRYIAEGQTERATAALGRPFFVEGEVRRGKGLARTWNTPTINLALPEELILPRLGVYRSRVHVEGAVYTGITNVGCRPTVDDGTNVNVETYILDQHFGEIQWARVELLNFIRPEQKFEDEKSLQLQIAKDIQLLKEL